MVVVTKKHEGAWEQKVLSRGHYDEGLGVLLAQAGVFCDNENRKKIGHNHDYNMPFLTLNPECEIPHLKGEYGTLSENRFVC